MPEPVKVLESAKKHLTKGAKIWATEVFNSSFYVQPDLPNQRKYYEAYNQLQISMGGNPDVGAQLGNLLKKTGFHTIEIYHDGFHLDQSKPEELQKMLGFWTLLLKSGAPGLLEAELISAKEIEEMERDLISVFEDENAVFFYQFVQAKATL